MNAQFGNASSDAFNRVDNVPSRVSGLLELCFPPYIARFVVPVVVNSSKTVRIGTFSDVSEKRLERINPGSVNGYSPTPVVCVILSSAVEASSFHITPCSVGAGGRPIDGLSMLGTGECRYLALKASAGTGMPAKKTFVPNNNLSSAFANANTPRPSFAIFGKKRLMRFNNDESCKSGSRKYFFKRHNSASSLLCSSSGRPETTGARCDSDLNA